MTTLRDRGRDAALWGLQKAPCRLLRLGLGQPEPVCIPFYHLVCEEPPAFVRHLGSFRSRVDFERDVDYFARHYEPLTIEQLVALTEGRRPATGRPPIMITFDDGFRGAAEDAAPRLLSVGLSAIFFLCPMFLDNRHLGFRHLASALCEHLGRISAAARHAVASLLAASGSAVTDLQAALLHVSYARRGQLEEAAALLEFDVAEYLTRERPYMSTEDVRRLLRQGFYIGAHSLDHPHYVELSLAEQENQTLRSLDELENRFQLPSRLFAFPFDDDEADLRLIRSVTDPAGARCDLSFGIGGFQPDVVPRHLPRFCMDNDPRDAESIVRDWMARRVLRRLIGKGIKRRPL